jgi:hypothetical protein
MPLQSSLADVRQFGEHAVSCSSVTVFGYFKGTQELNFVKFLFAETESLWSPSKWKAGFMGMFSILMFSEYSLCLFIIFRAGKTLWLKVPTVNA